MFEDLGEKKYTICIGSVTDMAKHDIQLLSLLCLCCEMYGTFYKMSQTELATFRWVKKPRFSTFYLSRLTIFLCF